MTEFQSCGYNNVSMVSRNNFCKFLLSYASRPMRCSGLAEHKKSPPPFAANLVVLGSARRLWREFHVVGTVRTAMVTSIRQTHTPARCVALTWGRIRTTLAAIPFPLSSWSGAPHGQSCLSSSLSWASWQLCSWSSPLYATMTHPLLRRQDENWVMCCWQVSFCAMLQHSSWSPLLMCLYAPCEGFSWAWVWV